MVGSRRCGPVAMAAPRSPPRRALNRRCRPPRRLRSAIGHRDHLFDNKSPTRVAPRDRPRQISPAATTGISRAGVPHRSPALPRRARIPAAQRSTEPHGVCVAIGPRSSNGRGAQLDMTNSLSRKAGERPAPRIGNRHAARPAGRGFGQPPRSGNTGIQQAPTRFS